MNCQQSQKKIRDSLAAGESRLAPELAAHENSCEACRQFHAAQLQLFRSLEIGLRSISNAPVPASLLPGVRAQLEQETVSLYAALPRWTFVVAAAVAFLAVSTAYALRHPAKQFHLPQTISTAAVQTPGKANPLASSIQESPKSFRPPASKGVVRKRPSASAFQIIVPPDERTAFIRLLAELPQHRDLALALAQPAPKSTDAPVEIAVLQIDVLDLAPIEAVPIDGTPGPDSREN